MALRVLTQINYSAGQNPEGDSGLRFTLGLLGALVRADPDLHFYLLVPERHRGVWEELFRHARITLLPIALEPRLHGGDFQFCPVRLAAAFDLRRYDVDLLLLNQPETAPALLQFFNRQTFHHVPAISYLHWFDTRRPSTPKQTLHHPALLATLSGLMASTAVGCNSAFGRDQILEYGRRWFNGESLDGLRRRIRLLPPGVDVRELLGTKRAAAGRGGRRVLVNHRLLKYTGVRGLLTNTLPNLWERRRDFTVVVTNPTGVSLPGSIVRAPWLQVKTLSREEYLRELWRCDIVIGPHRACHWSMSTLEAICAGCIPLMNRESFFPELLAPLLATLGPATQRHVEDRWLYYRGELGARLSDLLDDLPGELRRAQRLAAVAREVYDWDTLALEWVRLFREAVELIPSMPLNNPSMRRIADLLQMKGKVNKAEVLRHLGWTPKQRTLSWTAFRQQLKQIASEDANLAEAVFELAGSPKGGRRQAKRAARAR